MPPAPTLRSKLLAAIENHRGAEEDYNIKKRAVEHGDQPHWVERARYKTEDLSYYKAQVDRWADEVLERAYAFVGRRNPKTTIQAAVDSLKRTTLTLEQET